MNVYTSDYLTNFNIRMGKGNTDEDGSITNNGTKDQIAEINEKLLEKTKLLQVKEALVNKEYLISCSRDKTVMMWDVNGGVCLFTFTGHDNWVREIYEHPSGKYFVSCSDDKSIRVWDLKTGLCAKKLTDAHESFVVAISMSPKCKMLASCSNDMTIKIWECN